MKKDSTVLALIPARGGSKSIPRKNISTLAGHPLIAYSIRSAIESRHINRVVVSTDDQEIADIARTYGAETPFLRPGEYSQDDTPDLPVFEHALRWFDEHEGYRPDIIAHLRPTTPYRRSADMDEAIETFISEREADSLRSVSPSTANPWKMYTVSENRWLEPLMGESAVGHHAPRQLLPQAFQGNGVIDLIRRHTIMELHSMRGQKALAWMMDEVRIDIDTPDDWDHLLQLIQSGSVQLPEIGRRDDGALNVRRWT